MPTVTKTMTLAELRETLAPAEEMDRVMIDPRSGGVSFGLDDGKLRFNVLGESYRMTKEPFLYLCQGLGIPKPYVEKTPAPLMVPHLNYWLEHSGVASISFAAQDGVVVLFSKGAVEPVSNYQIIDILEDVTESADLVAHHVSHDLTDTMFSIVTRDEKPVAVGDMVSTGLTIENSYTSGKLQISTYVHRLVCTNGAISSDNVFRYSHRIGSGTADWLLEAVSQALHASEFEVDRLRKMREIRLTGHLSDSIGSIFEQFSVPAPIQESVRDRVMDQGAETLYDLYNIITDVASNDQEVLENPDLSRKMMAVGGRMAEHHELCTSCHRVLIK